MEFLTNTWHWSISGFIIGLIMLLLTYFGKNFGMSSNIRHMCAMTGVGKYAPFFANDWKSQIWNLTVVFGAMLGGFFAVHYLSNPNTISISANTIVELKKMGFNAPNGNFLPSEIFSNDAMFSVKNFSILIIGGFLVGFGSRYAGGCTSGHAISGLSNLQQQSLKAVIGFFVGGLVMAHFVLPLIF
jgi:uncharacterized membrane protein YedE/YeeE